MKKALLNNHLLKSVVLVQLVSLAPVQMIVLFGIPTSNLSMNAVAKSTRFTTAIKAENRMTLKYPLLSSLKMN